MKKLLAASMFSLALVSPLVVQSQAHASFSGVQGHGEWADVGPPTLKSNVNRACNCSGAWTGNDGVRDGNYWREIEYLHSGGFSLIYYRQADDGSWHVFWKKRWIDYDGPDQTVFF